MPFPAFEPTIPVLLRAAVERHGDRTLIVQGDVRMTYRDADERSARLACGLLASGIGKGTRVGLLMPNGPDWIVACLAVTRIGGLLVPINTFYQPRELGWVLRHADVHTLLAVARFRNHDYLARLEAAIPELGEITAQAASSTRERLLVRSTPFLRNVHVWGENDRVWAQAGPGRDLAPSESLPIDREFLRAVESCVAPADPMVIIYTSGSTAEPRGAVHTHGTIVRHAYNLNSIRDLAAEDRIWSPMPYFWVGGLVLGVFSPMHVGACVLGQEVFEPRATLDLLERERATIAGAWPHYGKAMADDPSFPGRDLSSLRAGNYEILPADKRPANPELRPNSLGMTETCGPHTFGRETDPPEKLLHGFGRALDGVEHKVVDPETGVTVPPGIEGEICVRGYSVAQGLYKMEREQTFDADGFYHTRDGGWFDTDGYLFFKARLGDMIKTAGANVAPSEVEIALETFPEVKEAFVVGVPDPARGENVAAAVVLNHGRSATAEALRSRLRSDLAAYKVPRHFFFYADGELPFTDTGKIDKRKLKAMLAERVGTQPGSGA
jgi:acyl-CoA synthetase (AMP-forming)/AMP-acid ligase II